MKLKLKVKSTFATPAQKTKSIEDMLRQAIEAENDAVCQYRQYAELCDNEAVKNLFLDLMQDEKTHFEQLSSMLSYIDPYSEIAKNRASQENDNILGQQASKEVSANVPQQITQELDNDCDKFEKAEDKAQTEYKQEVQKEAGFENED